MDSLLDSILGQRPKGESQGVLGATERMVDPLVVLNYLDEGNPDAEDDESLEEMIEQSKDDESQIVEQEFSASRTDT